ncbi:uncharacterized protein [Miscanthus floridulus]|uniref:uncharacterized protein isoform X1 n=1 Tax=Miscanthus floridulus TaxID=154761 RepID=UPI00345AC6B7
MASAASSAAGAGKSLFQGLRRFLKKPWEITGPCASPEYRSALPDALEYRVKCPATVRDDRDKAIVPTSDPETVYDIKYFTRDRRRNRPPVRRTLLRKPELERYMATKQFDPTKDFPVPYVNTTVEEDDNTVGGGYQNWLRHPFLGLHQKLHYFHSSYEISLFLLFQVEVFWL